MLNTSWMLQSSGSLMEANAHASEVVFLQGEGGVVWNWWDHAGTVYNDCPNQ